jgi:outer membrane protein assembly factor BamB
MYAVGGVYADGQFFEASPASHEFADFDARTGKMLWSLQTSKSVKMSAIVHDGLVYFGDVGNTLYVVKEKSGQVLQRVAFPGTFGISPPILVGDTVFVVNGNSVYASRARDLLRGIGPRG